MSLHTRIKEARINKGYTQAQLGSMVGVANTTIAGYEKNREPTAAQLGILSEALDVDVSFLLQDEIRKRHDNFATLDEMEKIKKYRVLDIHGKRAVDSVLDVEYGRMTHVVEQETQGAITYINCYDLAVSAGLGEPWGSDSGYRTRLEIPSYQVPESAHYCARVNGNSMEPAYKDGDIVFVQRLDEMVRFGEIGIFFLNGDGYIKRLGYNQLESLNPKYEPIPIHDYDDIRCQGRVLGKL